MFINENNLVDGPTQMVRAYGIYKIHATPKSLFLWIINIQRSAVLIFNNKVDEHISIHVNEFLIMLLPILN